MTRALFALLGLIFAGAVSAEEALPPGSKVVKLAVVPEKVTLGGAFSYAQVVVTATLSAGPTCDATRLATVAAPKNVTVSPSGVVRPAGDGPALIRFTLQDQSAEVHATPMLRPVGINTETSFIRDVMPLVSK